MPVSDLEVEVSRPGTSLGGRFVADAQGFVVENSVPTELHPTLAQLHVDMTAASAAKADRTDCKASFTAVIAGFGLVVVSCPFAPAVLGIVGCGAGVLGIFGGAIGVIWSC